MISQSKSVVRAHREPMWKDRIHIHLYFVRNVDGVESISQATAVKLKPVPEGIQTAPTFSLQTEEAQQLMDELWHCGLRPTDGSGSAGSLAATERHLKDLQRLVFKDKPAPAK
jgi:hypothetical protein